MPRIYQIAPPRSPLRMECLRLFGCMGVCAIASLAGKFGLPVLCMVFPVLHRKRGLGLSGTLLLGVGDLRVEGW